ncbi:hypothetical protein [Poriferisphaera sp. WC338]|uniref:hypothetical protein n=1 Tax=Poriferisphaera sp. WC338 TaxID=3425129 RepID=UPI003D814D4A
MKETPLPLFARPFRPLLILLSVIVFTMGTLPTVAVQAQDKAQEAARNLFKDSLQPSRDGRSHNMISALRHLKDPTLAPYFHILADSATPMHQIHGHLGLAEISESQSLDMAALAEVTDPLAQGEIITAAMDSDLVTDDQLKVMLEWPGLDIGVKMLILTKRLSLATQGHMAPLEEAIKSDKPARSGLAGLLLHQLGDPRGKSALDMLDELQDSQRDPIRGQLLEIVLAREMESAADWALRIAQEPDVHPKLKPLALQTALRFNHPAAVEVWKQTFQSTSSLAYQYRYAIDALRVAPYQSSQSQFEFLATSENPMLKQIGVAGISISTKGGDIADQVVALVDFQHSKINSWAIKYANTLASPEDAQLILFSIIYSYQESDPRHRLTRLDESVTAAQYLFELSPEMALRFMRPILSDTAVDPELKQAILLGLVRSQTPGGSMFIQDGDTFGTPESDYLALLLLAKDNKQLTELELKDMALVVRGGSGLQTSLRIQAAWQYLKYIGADTGRFIQALK